MLRLFTKKNLRRFYEDESGPTAVEYALIVVVCIGAVQSLATATKGSLDASSDAIEAVL
jgi:Flp pilus assembly pilin Flp